MKSQIATIVTILALGASATGAVAMAGNGFPAGQDFGAAKAQYTPGKSCSTGTSGRSCPSPAPVTKKPAGKQGTGTRKPAGKQGKGQTNGSSKSGPPSATPFVTPKTNSKPTSKSGTTKSTTSTTKSTTSTTKSTTSTTKSTTSTTGKSKGSGQR